MNTLMYSLNTVSIDTVASLNRDKNFNNLQMVSYQL